MDKSDVIALFEEQRKERYKKVKAFNDKKKIVKCPNCKKEYRAMINTASDFYCCLHCACIGNLPLKWRLKHGLCYDLTMKAILDNKKAIPV